MNSNRKILTIIVQGYNPLKEELKRTITSLNEQLDKDFKVIFFDNGSEVDWSVLIHEFQVLFDYKFIRVQENKGIASGRNLAISYCEDSFIARIDDGDWVSNDFTKKINDKIKVGNDLIIIPKDFKKNIIHPDIPMYYILEKRNMIEFPRQPKYFTEDFCSCLYYISKSKYPAIIDVQYYRSTNQRWKVPGGLLKQALNYDNPSLRYWEEKIDENAFSVIPFKMLGVGVKINQSIKVYSSKIRYKGYMKVLRWVYENTDREHLYNLRKAYKKNRKIIINPKFCLWPPILYRFFKRSE